MIIGFEAQRIFRTNKHGMDFVALELIRALQKLDMQNQYVVFTNEGPDTDCLHESPNLKIVTFGGSFPVWEQILLPKYVKKYGCDMLHCTSNTAPVFAGVPTVLTLHDIIFMEKNPLFAKGYNSYQRFGNYYRRLVVRMNLKMVKKIITVSKFEKKRLLDFLKLPAEKVDVVYNGVGRHFFEAHNSDEILNVRKRYNLPDKYILFLGNTDPKKNTRNTILAFAKFINKYNSDTNLVVADLNGEVVKEILKSGGLEQHLSRIYFSGYINNRDLPAIIQGAELFLYPSKRESFGIPILESMAAGTAVITSNTSSMPEVSDESALLVDPLNVDEIAQGIERIYSDKDLREDFVKKGKKRATEFQWSNSAHQMLAVYKAVVQ